MFSGIQTTRSLPARARAMICGYSRVLMKFDARKFGLTSSTATVDVCSRRSISVSHCSPARSQASVQIRVTPSVLLT